MILVKFTNNGLDAFMALEESYIGYLTNLDFTVIPFEKDEVHLNLLALAAMHGNCVYQDYEGGPEDLFSGYQPVNFKNGGICFDAGYFENSDLDINRSYINRIINGKKLVDNQIYGEHVSKKVREILSEKAGFHMEIGDVDEVLSEIKKIKKRYIVHKSFMENLPWAR